MVNIDIIYGVKMSDVIYNLKRYEDEHHNELDIKDVEYGFDIKEDQHYAIIKYIKTSW